ncbi:fumarylacetoacetate hydrolase family protein [Piscinibacter koreensis]|uniref:Fumarylacetoacetate hydrolase family protein n=1 Tax=Piscinibacter koreensis TaxID=2742824 RepID=A0A7Y6NMU1_9BURK|nr:fumarylacetoacetate hydrolase family protein [Schlegelella koreensis]NUZ06103.1 fumarylacetoacetate hydrolase family protein [Schlegelella koreensis]
MKIASFDDHRIGLVDGDVVRDTTAALPAALDLMPQQRVNWLIENWDEVAPRLQEEASRAAARPLDRVRLLPANPAPPHVFAAPANYRKHIGELGSRVVTKQGRSAREQGFFLKAPGSLVGHRGTIGLPKGSTRRFDHESELAVVVGKGGRDIPRADAMAHVFGYACLIDATMRIEPGVAEEERSMRKSFAGFTPLGPWLVTADEVPEPQALSNRLWVNGELRQQADTSEMIVGIAELIELISSVLPIRPGDVIATGTPEGVGPFAPGDTLRIAIDGVGEMSVDVRENAAVSPRAY